MFKRHIQNSSIISMPKRIESWKYCHKNTFLQGDHLKRDVFVKAPLKAGCDESFLWKLIKCIYGPSDASLMWYDQVKRFILSCKGKVSRVDPALFLVHEGSNLEGLIYVHVHNFLRAGT